MNRESHFQDTREHLLATGEAVMRLQGFSAVGLAEILSAAGVPKGSFYHYFKSKENFGAEMLKRYFDGYEARLKGLAERSEGTARQRLLAYFKGWASQHEGNGCKQGCFATKLSGEVSDLSESMRLALVEGMALITDCLAEAIRVGQAEGSLVTTLDPEATAETLYSLWIGADLRAKVQRDAVPLHRALAQTEVLLATP